MHRNDEVRQVRARFYVIAFVAFVAFVSVIARLYAQQVRRGEDFVHKSEQNFVQRLRLTADRGLICDTKRHLPVDNREAFNLVVAPAFGQGLRAAQSWSRVAPSRRRPRSTAWDRCPMAAPDRCATASS